MEKFESLNRQNESDVRVHLTLALNDEKQIERGVELLVIVKPDL